MMMAEGIVVLPTLLLVWALPNAVAHGTVYRFMPTYFKSR